MTEPARVPASAERPCPGCGADLTHVVMGTTYSRATSIEVRGVYDGGLFYAHTRQSGGCGAAWHRWPEGHPLHLKAQPWLERWRAKNEAE